MNLFVLSGLSTNIPIGFFFCFFFFHALARQEIIAIQRVWVVGPSCECNWTDIDCVCAHTRALAFKTALCFCCRFVGFPLPSHYNLAEQTNKQTTDQANERMNDHCERRLAHFSSFSRSLSVDAFVSLLYVLWTAYFSKDTGIHVRSVYNSASLINLFFSSSSFISFMLMWFNLALIDSLWLYHV